MATLQRAIEIATAAHAKQVDKGGFPYVLHPLRIMQALSDTDAKIVGVLHDVVEDCGVTAEDLRREGFSGAVVAGVLAVTRRAGESYADFVVRSKADPIGRAVKVVDLLDNYGLPRAMVRPGQVKRDVARLGKYALSYKFLTDAIGEVEYREGMGALAEALGVENA